MVTGPDCRASVKCQSQTAPLRPEGSGGAKPAPTNREGIKNNLTRLHLKTHLLACAVFLSDYPSVKPSASSCDTKTSFKMSRTENDNCFKKKNIIHYSYNTSSVLLGDGTVRSDWNLMLLLTSASPAVTVPLFIITAAVEEHGWPRHLVSPS